MRAVVQGDAAQQLHVEVPHAERPPAGLAHQGKGLGQQPIERLAGLGPIPQRQAALCAAPGRMSFCSSGSKAAILGKSSAQRASFRCAVLPERA